MDVSQRPNFKAMLTRYVENGIKSKIEQFFGRVFVQVEMETGFFSSENDTLQLFFKEEKVGHNTLGWISIELLISSILRTFFSFFNNVTEIVEGVLFLSSFNQNCANINLCRNLQKMNPFLQFNYLYVNKVLDAICICKSTLPTDLYSVYTLIQTCLFLLLEIEVFIFIFYPIYFAVILIP